ncbi:hypothetical protein FO519_004349 [Halicephalobus sp. NKZ332]|nr:hypothetical protein FO519_004349 [Halicephalobus sp. NKZ332]
MGLRRLNYTFGSECGYPKIGWQLDPFGHSREHANILNMLGYEGLYFARQHHLEFDVRKTQKTTEFNWYTSNENPSRFLFTGSFDMYFTPPEMCWDALCGDQPVQLNPNFDNYNVDHVVANLQDYVENQRLPYLATKHVLFTMGSDFQYQNAEQEMRNIDNLITVIRNRTDYNIFYSTPACYTKAVQEAGVTWKNKTYDFFPYASGTNDYWTGYFTSKPALKGLVRQTSNILNTIRQLNTLSDQEDLDEWNSPEQVLERAAGLSQHHDGITGTSKEHVTQNYEYRIFKAWKSIEQVLQNAIQKIKNNRQFSIILYNGNSRDIKELVKIPLYDPQIALVDENDNSVEQAWILPTFVNGDQLNNSDISPYDLQFITEIPANGFNTYFVVPAGKDKKPLEMKEVRKIPLRTKETEEVLFETKEVKEMKKHPKSLTKDLASITNGLISVNFDEYNLVRSVVDIAKGIEYPLKQNFWYYEGHDDNGRASGAYIFRPQVNEATVVNAAPSLSVAYLEARQSFGDWVSQTIRLLPNETFVEFDWTVGPLPEVQRNGKNYGKELITRYETIINSGKNFYTDANGRQILKRIRNYNPDYTYDNSEPVAGNYYPVNALGILKDDETALAILTDRSQAGGSIQDGNFELLLHRRDFYDDAKGVDENLNEPGRDGRGLVVRGQHRLFFSSPDSISKLYRNGMNKMFHSPLLSFSTFDSLSTYSATFISKFSSLNVSLPENLKILTLKQLSPKTVLFRIEHFYSEKEDEQLSKPVTVDIKNIFNKMKINSIKETTLGSNKILENQVVTTTITLNPQDIRTFILDVSF